MEGEGGEQQETHKNEESRLPRPQFYEGEVGRNLITEDIYQTVCRRKERRNILDDDEELEEYEGFLPLRARKKARCLTTETVGRKWVEHF